MHNGNIATARRRSSRVPTALQILVTSLEGTHFSEVCETMVVNAHGCAILSPMKFDSGLPLRFHSKEGRETTAHVVSCQPMSSDNRTWKLGAKLDRPENFWGLSNYPEDWGLPTTLMPRFPEALPAVTTLASPKVPSQPSQPSEAMLDLVARRLEAPLRRMIAESVCPLQAQVTALQERLARREANPGRLEISLTTIPPELARQLELRLQNDLEPKVLEASRQQYEKLLQAAKATIAQRTTEGYEDFLRRAAAELRNVEKEAPKIAANISASAQMHLDHGLKDFDQRLLDGGNSIKRLSEELVEYIQRSLNDEHNARRGDLEQLRASVAAESRRLHEQVEYLDSRIAKLDEATRSLESGLDRRLSQMASSTLKDTRSQLETMANEALGQFTAHGATVVEDQLHETNEKMKIVQEEINTSVSESLKLRAGAGLVDFEHSIKDVAERSVEQWRLGLVQGLNALAKHAAEQFHLRTESGDDGNEQSGQAPG